MALTKTKTNGTGANLGFEAKLWAMADEFRGGMDVGEYKHVVLGLIFLSIFQTALSSYIPSSHMRYRIPTATTSSPNPRSEGALWRIGMSTPPRMFSGSPPR